MTEARAFTVARLAEHWDCSEGTIRNMIRRGELAVIRLGALIRIPAQEVENFECRNIASNDSAAVSPSSISGRTESASGKGYTRPTGLERRLRRGEAGVAATVHLGPWGGS